MGRFRHYQLRPQGDAVDTWKRRHARHEPDVVHLQNGDAAAVTAAGSRNTAPAYPTPLDDEHDPDNSISRTTATLMDSFPQDKHGQLVINFAGPHDPVDVIALKEKTLRGHDLRQPIANDLAAAGNPWRHGREPRQLVMGEQLEKRGELDNAVIVFSSDHGEILGNHNLRAKNGPSKGSACVPMVVAHPGGQRCAGQPDRRRRRLY